MSNATGVNSGAGVAYHPGSPDFIPGFQWGRDIVSGVILFFCILVIALSVLCPSISDL